MSDRSTWFRDRRLDYIDHLLSTRGQFNTRDISEQFGVSRSRASLDVRAYMDTHGKRSLRYDRQAMVYYPGPSWAGQERRPQIVMW